MSPSPTGIVRCCGPEFRRLHHAKCSKSDAICFRNSLIFTSALRGRKQIYQKKQPKCCGRISGSSMNNGGILEEVRLFLPKYLSPERHRAPFGQNYSSSQTTEASIQIVFKSGYFSRATVGAASS